MKLKLKSRRQLSLKELWAIEDKFPAVCGPSPSSYAARHGLTLSKNYLQHLGLRRTNGNGKRSASRRRKLASA